MDYSFDNSIVLYNMSLNISVYEHNQGYVATDSLGN